LSFELVKKSLDGSLVLAGEGLNWSDSSHASPSFELSTNIVSKSFHIFWDTSSFSLFVSIFLGGNNFVFEGLIVLFPVFHGIFKRVLNFFSSVLNGILLVLLLSLDRSLSSGLDIHTGLFPSVDHVLEGNLSIIIFLPLGVDFGTSWKFFGHLVGDFTERLDVSGSSKSSERSSVSSLSHHRLLNFS